jgi:signal transduction histidine kinase
VRELSLHILDLVENSLRAQATLIAISLVALPAEDLLAITIEDNGTGLKVPPAEALNPFYTTKGGKRTGLGLSLFKAAVEQAGGELKLEPSTLGTPQRPGLKVAARMRLRHVDRSPLGDLPGTLASVVCTNPQVEFCFHVRLGARESQVRVGELADRHGLDRQDALALARAVQDWLRTELQASDIAL